MGIGDSPPDRGGGRTLSAASTKSSLPSEESTQTVSRHVESSGHSRQAPTKLVCAGVFKIVALSWQLELVTHIADRFPNSDARWQLLCCNIREVRYYSRRVGGREGD